MAAVWGCAGRDGLGAWKAHDTTHHDKITGHEMTAARAGTGAHELGKAVPGEKRQAPAESPAERELRVRAVHGHHASYR